LIFSSRQPPVGDAAKHACRFLARSFLRLCTAPKLIVGFTKTTEDVLGSRFAQITMCRIPPSLGGRFGALTLRMPSAWTAGVRYPDTHDGKRQRYVTPQFSFTAPATRASTCAVPAVQHFTSARSALGRASCNLTQGGLHSVQTCDAADLAGFTRPRPPSFPGTPSAVAYLHPCGWPPVDCVPQVVPSVLQAFMHVKVSTKPPHVVVS